MKTKLFTLFAVLGIAFAVLQLSPASAAPTHRAVPPSTTTTRPAQPAITIPSGTTISGLDLHDGTIVEDASSGTNTYYFYGTQYGCGFQWGVATSHFCGFGVASAPSLSGPWSAITQLISPSTVDPWSGRTWDQQCVRTNGGGCFNPRMVHNPNTGQWLLWFNAVGDHSFDHANAYNNYVCSGPMGPCANSGFHKPAAYTCADANGDFSIFTDGATAYLVCTGTNTDEYVEQLNAAWTDGTGNIAGHGSGALFNAVEGAGIYKDPTTGLYIMTLSNPECGYCSGVPTIFGTAPNPIGPWSSPTGYAAAAGSGPQAMGARYRAAVNGNSCGGQPRTVMVLDGQAYQGIDLWNAGALNETTATYMIQPLNYRNAPNTATVGWQPFDPWDCS